ncbi:hypothetical protein DMENIID0001_087790 [Sergentomyia squamirostris]
MSVSARWVSFVCKADAEINSTYPPNADEDGNMEEDILYQRGASFSAKLDDSNAHIFDNTVKVHKVNTFTSEEDEKTRADGGVVTVSNELNDDGFYSKEDMSIYDDVNNNRLNLRSRDSGLYSRGSDFAQQIDTTTATLIGEVGVKELQNHPQENSSADSTAGNHACWTVDLMADATAVTPNRGVSARLARLDTNVKKVSWELFQSIIIPPPCTKLASN